MAEARTWKELSKDAAYVFSFLLTLSYWPYFQTPLTWTNAAVSSSSMKICSVPLKIATESSKELLQTEFFTS